MALVLLAATAFAAAVSLAYAEELQELLRRLAPAAPRPPPGETELRPVPASGASGGETLSMLDSLVKDLGHSDPARRQRALERLPHYPPGELSRRLVPLLDGPVDEHRDRVADLLLRCGGEEVLEPLHRYFLDRDELVAGRSAPAAEPEAPTRGRRRRRGARIRAFPSERSRGRRQPPEGPAPVVCLEGRRRARKGPGPEDTAFPPDVLHPQPEVRARALSDLLDAGHPHAYELACRVLGADPSPLVRGASAAALGRAPEERGGLEALCAATNDAEVGVRWNACYALGQLGNTGAKRALRFAENDADGSVRLVARKALEQLGLDPPLGDLAGSQ